MLWDREERECSGGEDGDSGGDEGSGSDRWWVVVTGTAGLGVFCVWVLKLGGE